MKVYETENLLNFHYYNYVERKTKLEYLLNVTKAS